MIGLLGGIMLGGIVSWGIAHFYYQRASREQRAAFDAVETRRSVRNTLALFEELLETASWPNETIEHEDSWVCEDDRSYQIVRGEREDEFREPWTESFPHSMGSSYPVFLKINGSIVKQLRFVSLDGARYFVPVPDMRLREDGSAEYFWNLGSLEVRVCRVIGEYYIEGGLEAVARRAGVGLVE